jgi:hypothetical protein
MLLRIDAGIILCALVEIHIEFQLLLVRYYSYQVFQNGSPEAERGNLCHGPQCHVEQGRPVRRIQQRSPPRGGAHGRIPWTHA